MTNRVDLAMQEVWDWKRRAEELTRGMSPAAVIEFYRQQADNVQRRFGLELTSRRAGDATRARRRSPA